MDNFNFRTYDNMYEGEFYLFKHKTLPYAVRYHESKIWINASTWNIIDLNYFLFTDSGPVFIRMAFHQRHVTTLMIDDSADTKSVL